MKWLEKHLKAIWAVAGVALALIVIIVVATSGSKQSTTNPTPQGQTATQDTVSLDPTKLEGFELASHVSENLYTYRTTEGGQSYSVSLGVKQSLLEQHKQNYPFKRNDLPYNGLTVAYGYNQALEANGQVVQPAYSSLAFDFTLDNTDYTGEITNLGNAASQDQLLAVLKRLVAAIN
ncbi:MAG: hypothetical protein AAB971_00395 [Patescibacteria group bacterium]